MSSPGSEALAGGHADRGRSPGLLGATPPTALVLLGVGSTQLGAALAKGLFDDLGAVGTVTVRVAVAALLLIALSRPSLRGRTRADLRLVAGLGIVLAGMNVCFFLAIERIPLGVVVTLEFVGPLGVAVAGSRRTLDVLWVLLAAAGVVLLGGGASDPVGVALALAAGAGWAGYILAMARVGRRFEAGTGLALAMGVAAVVLVPAGAVDAGAALLRPELLLVGVGVAVLSSALPYRLELEALRRLSPRVFGILMSTEPAFAALVGLVVLGERLGASDWLAVGLVMVASVGAVGTVERRP